MQLPTLFSTLLFAAAASGSAFPAAITPISNSTPEKHNICKKPYCTSFCPDGTKYNCCLTYVRDPCWDHQEPLPKCTGPDDFECLCRCEKLPDITYLCNARYFRDPCSPLPDEVTVS